MTVAQSASRPKVILLSTPWPLYQQPSIQLGSLKAYLRSQFPDLKVEAHHFYLQLARWMGFSLYKAVSERTWLAETVYAALLFPEGFERIERLFKREAAGKEIFRGVHFKSLTERVGRLSNAFLEAVSWSDACLLGVSVCLCQLTSSLYFIRRIKERHPRLPVAVGGSTFSGEGARRLPVVFPEVDFVVEGEGELPLAGLVRRLRGLDLPPASGGGSGEGPHAIPGVVEREGRPGAQSACFSQLEDLSCLPPPDFDEYFSLLRSFDESERFFPKLTAEASRGCWWRSRPPKDGVSGCAFCNLNLQWKGYRAKPPSQVADEIDHLTSKHRVLSVAFMDNALPLRESRKAFDELAERRKDFRFFAELRAVTPRRILKSLHRAGLTEVQVGIEALSSPLLQKMNKGTSAIRNMEMMRDCEELGLVNISNLIMHFPGSDEEDVARTLRALDFALPFRPLRVVSFWLGLESPVWEDPAGYGIRAVFNHPDYGILLPPHLARSMRFMVQGYRGDRQRQKKLWRPVQKKVKEWKKAYTQIHQGEHCEPVLSFQDGRDFLIIRQRRLGKETLTHRLVGPSRALYLYCLKNRSLERILLRFPREREERVGSFLKMMVDKKLMFEENGRYLSLAVGPREA